MRRRASRRGRVAVLPLLCLPVLFGCRDGTAPSILPAGTIVYASIPERFLRIAVQDVDGTDHRYLTDEGQTNLEPSWSPDGARIVFTSWRDGDPNIYLMEADGSNPRPLTSDPGNDRSARFSPDGTRIAFVSERNGNAEIYVMDADGSNPVNLTRDPASEDLDPAWSPDGGTLVFASTRGTAVPDVRFSLWTMSADGSALAPVPIAGEGRSPDWSPDGSRIVYTSLRGADDAEIVSIRPDGSDPRNLTRRGGIDELPRWSPDGTHILFSTKRDGTPEVYAMRADGSEPMNLTRNGHWDAMAAWRPRP